MRRLAVALAGASLLVASCTDSEPEPGQESRDAQVGAVAEVEVPGQPNPIVHGNDLLPPKPAGVSQVAPEANWPCEGAGTEGRRVQLLYVHGGQSNLSTLRPTFETFARQIEGMFLLSGRESGGERLLRFVTDAGCTLSILDRQVSADALNSFDAMIDELRQQGLTDRSRSYHAWVESSAYCGIGTIYSDDSPTGNLNESNAQYSRSDRPCWNANVAAHEIIHNLGGVQDSAPNATGGLHCNDESDVQCYADGAPKGQMRQVCPAPGEDRFDCQKNDYFSAAPPAGSYLATHWNVAESQSLTRSVVTPTTLPPPPPTTSTLPPTTTTSVGKGKTVTELTLPGTVRNGVPFTATAQVTGDCRPSGTVSFFVSGKLLSRQVLVNGSASVALTVVTTTQRPTFRVDYSGSDACATSRDTVRKRVQ